MVKNVRRSLLFSLIMVLLLGSVPVSAAPAISKKDALKIAGKYVPSGSKLKESDWDEDSSDWDFDFLTKNKKAKYELTIDGNTGKLLEIEKEDRSFPSAGSYSVSKKAAKKKVLKTFKNAKIVKVRKTKEKGAKVYKITFTTSSYRGSAVVHGRTGKIIEWEKKFR